MRASQLEGIRRSEQNNGPLLVLNHPTNGASGKYEVPDSIGLENHEMFLFSPQLRLKHAQDNKPDARESVSDKFLHERGQSSIRNRRRGLGSKQGNVAAQCLLAHTQECCRNFIAPLQQALELLHQHWCSRVWREEGFDAYLLGHQHPRVRAHGNGRYTEARKPYCGMKAIDQTPIGTFDGVKVVACGLRKNSSVLWPDGASCLKLRLAMAQKDWMEAGLKTSDRLAEGGLP